MTRQAFNFNTQDAEQTAVYESYANLVYVEISNTSKMWWYLSHCFITMKRHQDQGNTYKTKYLIEDLLKDSEV